MSKDVSNNLNIQWVNSVKNIHEEDWNRIFGHSLIKSRKLFIVMEDSNFDYVEYHYLLIYKNDIIANIIPCFCYKLDLLHLVTSTSFKALISKCRKTFPNLLKLKTFVVGSYIATCEHFIEDQDKILGQEFMPNYIKSLNYHLKAKYQETNSQILFIKDIRQRYITYIRNILDKEVHFFKSFPTTAIPIFDNYPKFLKKKNRKRYRIFKQRFDSKYTWEVCYDFQKYIPLLSKLYLNVLNKADNKFEILNPSFFYNIKKIFQENSFFLIARNHNNEIVLGEIVIEDEDRLLPLYLGIDYEKGDTKVLYLNTIFRTIKEAEIRNKSFVDFGQTSYYPKVMSGAFIEHIYYGFWSNKPFFSWLINNVFKYIFIPPTIFRNTYLEKYKKQSIKKLEDKGFILVIQVSQVNR